MTTTSETPLLSLSLDEKRTAQPFGGLSLPPLIALVLDVFGSAFNIAFDQAENRLHTIKALLVATLGD